MEGYGRYSSDGVVANFFEGDDPEAMEPVKAEAAGQVQAKSEAGDKEARGSPKEVKEKVGSPPA